MRLLEWDEVKPLHLEQHCCFTVNLGTYNILRIYAVLEMGKT